MDNNATAADDTTRGKCKLNEKDHACECAHMQKWTNKVLTMTVQMLPQSNGSGSAKSSTKPTKPTSRSLTSVIEEGAHEPLDHSEYQRAATEVARHIQKTCGCGLTQAVFADSAGVPALFADERWKENSLVSLVRKLASATKTRSTSAENYLIVCLAHLAHPKLAWGPLAAASQYLTLQHSREEQLYAYSKLGILAPRASVSKVNCTIKQACEDAEGLNKGSSLLACLYGASGDNKDWRQDKNSGIWRLAGWRPR